NGLVIEEASDLNLSFNTTNSAIDETIGGIRIQFLDASTFFAISGMLALNVSNIINLKNDPDPNKRGRFGFKLVGSEIHVVDTEIVGSISVGTFKVGLSAPKLGLLIRNDGKVALDTSGALILTGGGFGSVTATA